ncbi:hypothetical protein ACFOUP_01905 [Belliella kenyensis]|uniref:Uncharacterized protein n=1 Tax=Belliella kenyensis TaxID=1472724 RepID=A0ABV8EGW0_9BACT
MQPLLGELYLSSMAEDSKKRLINDRIKWCTALLICLITAMIFSHLTSENSYISKVLNPISYLKNLQENQIRTVFTKLIRPEILDDLKRL